MKIELNYKCLIVIGIFILIIWSMATGTNIDMSMLKGLLFK